MTAKKTNLQGNFPQNHLWGKEQTKGRRGKNVRPKVNILGTLSIKKTKQKKINQGKTK